MAIAIIISARGASHMHSIYLICMKLKSARTCTPAAASIRRIQQPSPAACFDAGYLQTEFCRILSTFANNSFKSAV